MWSHEKSKNWCVELCWSTVPRLGHWNMNLHWYYLVSTLHLEKTKPASYHGDGLLEALCWDVAPAAPRFVSAPPVPLTRAVAGIGTEEEGSIWGPRGSEEGKVCLVRKVGSPQRWVLHDCWRCLWRWSSIAISEICTSRCVEKSTSSHSMGWNHEIFWNTHDSRDRSATILMKQALLIGFLKIAYSKLTPTSYFFECLWFQWTPRLRKRPRNERRNWLRTDMAGSWLNKKQKVFKKWYLYLASSNGI